MAILWKDPRTSENAAVRLRVPSCGNATARELEDVFEDALAGGAGDVILELDEPLDLIPSATLDGVLRIAERQLTRGKQLWLDAPARRIVRLDRRPLDLLRQLRDIVRGGETEEAGMYP
jgi:hypothetical protein